MALKRKVKDQSEKSFLKPMFSDELLFRVKNIVEETGISPSDLAMKWVLQEETLIGLTKRSREPIAEQAEIRPDLAAQENSEPGNLNNRKTLVKRAVELKKSGMSLNKIAETFNGENIPTVSGTGKWYASTIANLLKPKK